MGDDTFRAPFFKKQTNFGNELFDLIFGQREYALFCNGRYVSQARGEQEFFHEDGIPTATEGCKSNGLNRY